MLRASDSNGGMIDYHGHLAPARELAEAQARGFMPFPKQWPRALTQMEGHIEEMEQTGIRLRYLSVPPILYGYELATAEQARLVARLNDWIIEAARPPHFAPTCILPLGDAEATLAEI